MHPKEIYTNTDNKRRDLILKAEYENMDTAKLLLSASKYHGIDIKEVVNTLEARKKIKDKIPEWYKYPDIIYPPKVSIEQSSSEATARYKASLITSDDIIIDLTGGMGVDSYFFSLKAKKVYYNEKNTELTQTADTNFKILHADNISTSNIEIPSTNLSPSIDILHLIKKNSCTVAYLDPSRRSSSGLRTYAISDCEPNVLGIMDNLIEFVDTIIIKLSPMLDISSILIDIPKTTELHVISQNNECKELLLIAQKGQAPTIIKTVNIHKNNSLDFFSFYIHQERDAKSALISNKTLNNHKFNHLYDPNRSIIKAGAYKLIGERFDLYKADINSHLYFSESLIEHFPGRIFQIVEIVDFNKRGIQQVSEKYRKSGASIATRNFSISPEELRKRLKLKESDKLFIFATTIAGSLKLIIAQKGQSPFGR